MLTVSIVAMLSGMTRPSASVNGRVYVQLVTESSKAVPKMKARPKGTERVFFHSLNLRDCRIMTLAVFLLPNARGEQRAAVLMLKSRTDRSSARTCCQTIGRPIQEAFGLFFSPYGNV
jgi:hypothetical protein